MLNNLNWENLISFFSYLHFLIGFRISKDLCVLSNSYYFRLVFSTYMFRTFKSLNFKQLKSFHLATTMPKSKKSEGKAKDNSDKNPATSYIKGAVYLGKESEIIMKIHAKPGAKESAITDVGSETVGVQIAAPPLDGEANKELLRYLAEILKLRKSDLTLEKGSRSKEKTVIISKDVPLHIILETLQAASKQK